MKTTLATTVQKDREALDQRIGPAMRKMMATLNIEPEKFDEWRERQIGEGRAALNAGRALTISQRCCLDAEDLAAGGEVGFATLTLSL